jgi:hypothetical protein
VWLEVKTQWLKKNVDLSRLNEPVEAFLKREGFKVSMREDRERVEFFAAKKHEEKTFTIIVTIEGEPSNFTIELEGKNVSESAYMFTNLLSLFGLGGLLAKKVDLLSVYRAIEDKFFAFMDDVVEQLANSAK